MSKEFLTHEENLRRHAKEALDRANRVKADYDEYLKNRTPHEEARDNYWEWRFEQLNSFAVHAMDNSSIKSICTRLGDHFNNRV